MTVPTGTLTFLFTDIEGSTRLWEEQPARMQSALARHDALVRSAIEENGGHVFKTIGDAFCAAFPTAPGAVVAALHVQRALAAEAALAPLRVRMALHTGTAEQRDGDYFGPALNRVARLLAAGHGGQVLLSNTTRELVRDSLPEGTGLRDLGEHRLKDLVRPEHIFQLDAAGLPPEHPPLKSLNPRPHNLPVQPTPLIGRERELREILDRLQGGAVRLLTLTGPGGTGKTRLALQAAAELADEFPDGVFFVNLASVRDVTLVPSAIAQVLGVREAGGRPLAEILQEHLEDKRVLLVLDNFEQITDAAPVVAGLLGAAPGLQVLATSRIALRLRGEQEFGVPPLSLPDPKRLPRLEQLTQYDAVRLFIERARAVKPDFAVSNENAPAVAEICHRLDGLPLAIELAASRIRILPPQAMLARLQSRLKLLTGGARDLPQRHQTLRGAIAWSYDLLSEGEQVLFRRLSVFAGGRTLEAIEQVCDAEGELDVIEGVSSLVEKSLLRQEEDAEGEPRFVMLETIHEFAREVLDESGEAADIRRRHAEFFLSLARVAEQHWYDAEQGRWLARMETEHDNFRAALRSCLDAGQAETAGLMAETLWTLWYRQSQYREGRQWLQDVLSAGGLSSRTRAAMLYGAGVLARLQGDFAAARPLLEESLSLSREQGDMNAVTRALIDLGALAAEQDDLEQAEALYEEAAALSRESGKHRTVATVLNNLGNVATRRFDYARAESLYRESLDLARQSKDTSGTGLALANLGYVTYRQGDLSGARTHLREALRSAREAGFLFLATHGLAHLAEVESEAGAWERAARLFGVAEARFAAMGSHVSRQRREAYDQRLAAVRDQLGESAWEQTRQEGAALTFDEVIAYALGEEQPDRAEDPTRVERARGDI